MANRKDGASSRSHFWIDDLHVQPEKNIVTRGDEEIKLEKRMMEILVELAHSGGEPVSKDALLEEFWSDDNNNVLYDDNPVTKAIAGLRKKIGDDIRKPRYIRTLHKRGYCIIPKVQFAEGYRHEHGDFGTWKHGNPYVGLRPFDRDHAEVFQGRSGTLASLMTAMREQIDNERRFVLIAGPSGCGKTSLVRASMIPKVSRQTGFDGLYALSATNCDLGTTSDGDVMMTLATSLGAWTLEGRAVFSTHPPDHLRKLLIEAPEQLAGILEDAFRRSPKRGIDSQPYAHLLLTIDHAETLVAGQDVTPEQRNSFSRAVRALCDSPRTLTAMIARLDLYPELADALPELAGHRSGYGYFEVSTPNAGELAKIIRKPAALAGVDFEEHPTTQKFLDDLLLEKTIAQRDALPLLQHTLHTLYERCGGAGLMTYTAFEELGGLEGAIAHRAEEVFTTLPAEVGTQDILDSVLAKLVVIQPGSEAITAHRARTETLSDNARVLVEAFVRGRLFVSELHDGEPHFGVVHEALLRQWPRAAEWVQENRRLLMAKARLRRAAERWDDEGRQDDHLLNPGRPLIEAREVEQRYFEDIGEAESALLRASERMNRRKRLISRISIGALAALSIISTSLAFMATKASFAADRNRNEALDLIGYMLVELSDQLRPTASTAPMKSISTRALEFLERQPVEEMSSGDLINYSRALRTRGEVLSVEGKDAAASDLFERADKVARRAMKMTPSSTQAIAEAGQTAFWLGFKSRAAGKIAEATTEWERYLSYSEDLLKIERNNPDWQQEHAYATANLGYLDLHRNDCASAMLRLKPATMEMEQALKKKPEADSWRFNWIVAKSMATRCHAQEGRIGEASRGYDQQIAELKTLLRKRPNAIDWEQQLSSFLHLNANLSIGLGHIEHAEKQYLEAVDRLTIITKIQPSDESWKYGLANALMRAADMAYLRGDANTASARLRIAMRFAEVGKVAEDAKKWRRLSAMIHFRIGRYSTSSNSERTMSAGIESLSALANTKPEDVHTKTELANALISRGKWLRDAGRFEDAMQDWNDARLATRKIAIDTKDPDTLAPWINANMLLGRRADVETSIQTLTASGYAHPDFAALKAATR